MPSPRRPLAIVAAVALAAGVAGCGAETEMPVEPPDASPVRVTQAPFGTLPGGREVTAFTLRNPGGMEVELIDYGATITALRVPDRDGTSADVVLGFDDLDGYLAASPYFGAIVGRYGNRVAGGRFTLDGVEYQLATNNGPNHLHGGNVGFDKVLWEAEPFAHDDGPDGAPVVGVRLTYVSVDGEEGYPGTLTSRVTYTLGSDNALLIDYALSADAPTPANLTQHSYFNLRGAGDVLQHELRLNAARFTPVGETLIPTGELAPVAGTPFDFTRAKPIGRDIDADHEQIRFGGGFDHNFVLNRTAQADGDAPALVSAAQVYEPTTGRVLEVLTTEPGVQFYSGNFLNGTTTGKGGVVYERRSGFCLETQHFPDSPNQPTFPSTIVRPGRDYQSRTVFRFSAR